MSVFGYNGFPFLGPQIHCRHPNSFRLAEGGFFLGGGSQIHYGDPNSFRLDVHEWISNNFNVNFSDVTWLTTEDLVTIYYKVVHLGQSVQVECLVDQTARFIIKKLRLKIALVNRFLDIRLLSELVEWRVDVREDPSRAKFRLCRWPKPLDPYTRVINTDGSLKGERAAIGWIFRTSQGLPLAACSAPCQKMPIYAIEVWAVRDALRHAEGHFKFVVVEADATIAISMINTVAASYTDLVSTCQYNGRNYLEGSTRQDIRARSPRDDDKLEEYVKSVIVDHSQWTLGVDNDSLEFLTKALVDVIFYLEKFQAWGCKYLMREANRAADFLTKLAKEEVVFLAKTEEYPKELERIIQEDANDDKWYKRMKSTPPNDTFNESSGWRLL